MNKLFLRSSLMQFSVLKRTQMSASMLPEKISLEVKQGTINGKRKTPDAGIEYFVFKGIPYAKPPVKNLRFQPPVPLERFPENPLDCSREREASFQMDPFVQEITGSEDCLFLNVYTPKLKSEKALPVMVWIHGGAYVMDSGSSRIYLPQYLMEEDVVVVTLNYRLGPLGFLHFPEGGIPANAGLRDQLQALKWIKENISKFNGDPENITLFGQSAGAACVHLHALSPNSKQYFHKAILQSGTALAEWAIQREPSYKARKLAELMGCESKSDKEIGEFLKKSKNLISFLKHMLNTLTADERRRGLPMVFRPSIDANSEDPMVPKHPLETSLECNTIDIPLMMGYTSKEGITMVANAVKKLDEYESDFARLIPRSVNLDPKDKNCELLAKEIRKFYFKGDSLKKENLNEFVDLMTDYHFSIGLSLTSEILSRKQHKAPLYFYKFSYDGGLNLFKKWFKFDKIPGACHGDEMFYLFNSKMADSNLKVDSEDDKMKRKMCKLWANFAKYSNPTPSKDDLLNVTWNSVKKINDEEKFTLDYLEIDKTLKMKQNPDKERIEFWRNIYTKFNKGLLHAKL